MTKKKLISTKMKIIMASTLALSIASFTIAGTILYNSDYKLSNYFDINEWELHFYNNSDTSLWRNKLSTSTVGITDIENLGFTFDSNIAKFESYNGDSVEISLYANEEHSPFQDVPPFITTKENNNVKISPNPEVISASTANKYRFIVKIPTSYNKNLKINSLRGDISFNTMDLNSLDIQTINSDISLSAINCANSKINITNGSINTKAVKSKELSIKGVNSHISLSELSGNVNISSTNSSVRCTVGRELTNLNTTINTGDINVNVPSDGNFTITPQIINGHYHNSILAKDNHYDDYDDHKMPTTPFTLGNGENKINLSVVDGDINISY